MGDHSNMTTLAHNHFLLGLDPGAQGFTCSFETTTGGASQICTIAVWQGTKAQPPCCGRHSSMIPLLSDLTSLTTCLRLGTESRPGDRVQERGLKEAFSCTNKQPFSRILSFILLACLNHSPASCNALGASNAPLRVLSPVLKVRGWIISDICRPQSAQPGDQVSSSKLVLHPYWALQGLSFPPQYGIPASISSLIAAPSRSCKDQDDCRQGCKPIGLINLQDKSSVVV